MLSLGELINRILSITAEPIQGILARPYYVYIRLINHKKPLGKIFNEIYRKGTWGKDGSNAYSGTGSRGDSLHRTVQCADSLIARYGYKTILDIGCGDGTFIHELLQVNSDIESYLAVDVSLRAVETARSKNDDTRIDYRIADACEIRFERHDLVILRQVLQHLSNESIQKLIGNIEACGAVLTMEHRPSDPNAIPNLDIPSGAATRRFKNSFVEISLPPFKHGFSKSIEIDRFDLKDSKGVLVVKLYSKV